MAEWVLCWTRVTQPLPAVSELLRRKVRRHAITTLILYGGNGSPALSARLERKNRALDGGTDYRGPHTVTLSIPSKTSGETQSS